MLYTVVALVALLGMASLAVDWAHVQLVKSQLQGATDSAARYAAAGMRSTMNNQSGATANAQAVFLESNVDGTSAPFNSATDLSLGIWNPTTRVFVVTTDLSVANAVRLRTKITMGDSAHPLLFLPIFNKTILVHAESIAMITGQDSSTFVSAKGNPWLAGMPSGTVSTNFRSNASEHDSAGSGPNVASSPASISLASLNVTPGAAINFDGVTGSTDYGGGTTGNADGDSSKMITLGSNSFGDATYLSWSVNGMSNVYAPINSMMIVFLSDDAPNLTSAPAPLNFSTAASRDYTSLSPLLKQVAYVGDGRRSNGEIQQIIVPAGATRLFIANMDGWQYNNNTGGFNLTVHATNNISSVYMK